MKYAIVDGKLTHISKVKKGTIAREFGYSCWWKRKKILEIFRCQACKSICLIKNNLE